MGKMTKGTKLELDKNLYYYDDAYWDANRSNSASFDR